MEVANNLFLPYCDTLVLCIGFLISFGYVGIAKVKADEHELVEKIK